jgi:membrane protein implicated in regulation of membrane protease activity
MLRRGWSRQAVVRYVLLQVPGAFLAGLALVLIHRWTGLSAWIAWLLLGLWVAKDVVLFFFVWPAYEGGSPEGEPFLQGAQGVVRDRLDPSGTIRLHGQTWKARVVEGGSPVEPGEQVTVLGRDGLRLRVRSEPKR